MADEYIKVGQAFRVTCDIRDASGTAQIDPTTSTDVIINYRRPDGAIDTITPDQLTGNTVSGKVTAALNPKTNTDGPEKWRGGYPGAWEFYPSGTDASGDPWEAKQEIVLVHSRFRDPK